VNAATLVTAAPAPLSVLVVDDDPMVQTLIDAILSATGMRVASALTKSDALHALSEHDYDAVLLDLDLPDGSGVDICRCIRTTIGHEYTPVLFLTGHTAREVAEEAFQAGGNDFIVKPFHVPVFAHRILQAIAMRDMLVKLEREQQRLQAAERIARLGSWEWDVRSNSVRGSRECQRILGLRSGEDVSIGDFLAAFAANDQQAVGVGLTRAFQDIKPFRHRCELPSSRGGLSLTIELLGEPLLDASARCIGLRGSVQDLTSALDGPDLASIRVEPLMAARASGPAAASAADHEMRARLVKALDEREFHMVFQPQVDTRDDSISQVEALMRWCSSGVDMSPVRFVADAERLGLGLRLFEYTLDYATRTIAALNLHLSSPMSVAVNLSLTALEAADLPERALAILHNAGFDPNLLELEITESALLRDADLARASVDRLRSAGVRFSLDDFGTGFSSMSHLRHFPVEKIKIDRSFVIGLAEQAQDRAIVGAIAAIGARMGIHVLAEGVESVEQRDVLRDLGCHLVQGYLYARPLDADALRAKVGGARFDVAA
jgi:EAL domain-containing protein (putative c-di-GMP-specific phosphodiesterase class I)/DNA-binding response OmpR family regulator